MAISDDVLLNVYAIETELDGTAKTLGKPHNNDLQSDFFALTSNSLDKLATGGDNGKVDIHTF
jgi:hypothetical protein